MKKVKGTGQWSGKNVPGMYQKGGGVPKEIADSLKNIHTMNTIGNAHLLPDSIKEKFGVLEKMPGIKEEDIRRMIEKMKPKKDAKSKSKK